MTDGIAVNLSGPKAKIVKNVHLRKVKPFEWRMYMEAFELLKKTVEDLGFYLEDLEPPMMSFRYQLNRIVTKTEDGSKYITIMLPRIAEVNGDNYARVLEICNDINAEVKQVKAYVFDMECLMLSVESFYEEESDLPDLVMRSLRILVYSKKLFFELYR